MPKQKKVEIPKSPHYRRIKTPTLIQMEAVECGAAVLGIVLAYYGKFVPLEELRVTCSVSRDGANALSILQAAHYYGLDCEGYNLELQDLYDMPLPLIAFWNFEHFVVIEGFSKDCVFINDPAVGPHRITYEELDQSFTGLALVLEPKASFVKSGKPINTFTLLANRIKEAKIPFFFAFLAGLCLVLPKLALAAFTRIFLDDILLNHIFSWKNWFLIGLFFVAVFNFVFTFLQQLALGRLFIKLTIDYCSNFLWHILRLPLKFYYQRYGGEIANRMVLNYRVATTLTTHLAYIFIDSIVVFIYAIVMFYYDALIAGIGIAMIFGNLILIRYLVRSRMDAYAYFQQITGKGISFTIESLKNFETIKSTSTQHKLFSRLMGFSTKSIIALQTLGSRDVLSGVVSPFLQMLTTIAVLGVGAWRVIEGYLTIGMLMALYILMQNFMDPIVRLVGYLQTTQLLQTDIARLDDVLKNKLDDNLVIEEKNEHLAGQKFEHSPKLQGNLELRDITFGFNFFVDPILSDINLSIAPGQSVAIVGPSGSGKSTLAKVIVGLLKPWRGEILFDHMPRETLPRSFLTNSIALTEQEPAIFAETILKNIAYFEPLAEQQEIFQAAKDACIHDDIMLRKNGYDLMLDWGGSNLSGGQRQRINIAQSLVRRPSILILDEATSALDSETEECIYENIRRRGCTCIIIAHRMSTIKNCDFIIAIEKGKIVQQGTHGELMQTEGIYKTLVEASTPSKEETVA